MRQEKVIYPQESGREQAGNDFFDAMHRLSGAEQAQSFAQAIIAVGDARGDLAQRVTGLLRGISERSQRLERIDIARYRFGRTFGGEADLVA